MMIRRGSGKLIHTPTGWYLERLEFTCEDADHAVTLIYNKVAEGRSAQLQIGSNAASTLSFYSVQ